MYCPDCGTENSRGQKFCTRCGVNLIAIDRARDFITEVSTNEPVAYAEPSTILKIVAAISIFGFLFTTIGTALLLDISHGNGTISVMFCLAGFASLVLICRYLLKMIAPGTKAANRSIHPPAIYAPPPVRGVTNRSLGEAPPNYQSIIEDPTRQFESERRNK